MNSIIIYDIKEAKQGDSQRRKKEAMTKAQQIFKYYQVVESYEISTHTVAETKKNNTNFI